MQIIKASFMSSVSYHILMSSMSYHIGINTNDNSRFLVKDGP